MNVAIGDSITNAANGPGSGAVSYSSSDTTVATVDAAGVATVVGVGSAAITANKTTDTHYLAATASYTINGVVMLSAWIGDTDTLVNFPAAADGLIFYHSSAANCSLSVYIACPGGQKDTLSGVPLTDSAATLNQIGYYFLQSGNRQASLTVDVRTLAGQATTSAFSGRWGHQVVASNNRLWLIGGYDGSFKNDVWSSSDGIAWAQLTPAAAFSARSGFQVVAFNNQLWLIGGADSNSRNDVWSSTDGITWTQRSAAAAFSARSYHQVVAYHNQLWLIGGADGSAKNDVWSSSDGITWTQRTAAAAFQARSGHKVLVYNNKLWLIGGSNNLTDLNDVWASDDGINWTQQTSAAAFGPHLSYQAVAYNNQMWLVGGSNASDAWWSIDGITWTLQTTSASFSRRSGHQLLVYDNRLLLIGGQGDSIRKSDVWSSSDGFDWRLGFQGMFVFSR
ncbi:MAG TPA: hypothetical protein VLC91_16755 [Spongiibacteraceae bacterium]|nr:hypothetical protein [Spongiibacteraceae bacterium]